MERDPGGVAPESATFANELATLKREGSNILVVGADTADAHDAVCHRLLGDTDPGPRYRLFVTNSDTRSTSHGSGGTVESAWTIDCSELNPSADDPTVPAASNLGTLGIEIVETIDELDDTADGLAPSELRVCVDSLVPLLQEYAAEHVFRLLHLATSRVDHVDGMGHYHLPLDRDHDAVNLLEPLFDAIVEVRARDDRYEQRWYLRDQETSTDWISLDRRH
ncbi:hypothetical protein ACFO5R_16700 [Halosolutus amylolyticus]|uniref:Uncharacterized protein n=1 Tax=Halosolutus amylolyticus TaxID=2932267 RepID=A0ABD5PSX9_9EURY|nr:hypothetical protein [Halosolutus amylolyticus]